MFDPLAEAFRSAGFTPKESEAGAVRDVDGWLDTVAFGAASHLGCGARRVRGQVRGCPSDW
jgi:hypothetical protein